MKLKYFSGESRGTESRETVKNKRWQCKVCGFIHEGPEPPAICPVCGFPASEFVEV